MKVILLSGGSGKRLWPLSNDTRSKQFLKVLDNEHGSKESMVERVWKQLKKAGLAESTIITTSELQKEMIQTQLGMHVKIVTEPNRKDTFPAIALATTYLLSELNVSEEEFIAVLPVDPFVKDDFFESLTKLEVVNNLTESDLSLIGVKPTYPSEKYGYIVPSKQVNKGDFKVKKFVEKPSESSANKLINEGALWNCGVFGFKLKYLKKLLVDLDLPLSYKDLLNNYSSLPSISFDYQVVERAENITVTTYDGFWKDLGTWNTLTEEMASKQIGKGIISVDSKDTHLINELDIPVAIMGVNNIVVASSPDGILISEKASSPRIKELIKDFNDSPMYEERIWGWSRTLEQTKYSENEEMVTKRICIYKGKNSTYHYHKHRNEVWTIVKGEGELIIDDAVRRIKAGDTIHLPANKKHGVRAINELEFIEVQTGSLIDSNDIYRVAYTWEEILTQFKKSIPSIIL